MSLAFALVLVALGLLPSEARAEQTRALGHDLRIDIPVTVVSAGTAIGLQLAAGSLAPTCGWCGVNGLDDAVRNALRRNDPGPARVGSDVLVVAAPFVTFAVTALAANDEARSEDIALNSLLIAQATSIAMVVDGIAKVSFARERPAVRGLTASDTGRRVDDNVSFLSGHASFTFALATSAGTIALMRGYRSAPAVWAIGLPLAFATSYLRIAADRSYFTDVVGGMLVGSLVGVGAPLLFHRPVSDRVIVGGGPVAGGHVVTLTFPSPI